VIGRFAGGFAVSLVLATAAVGAAGPPSRIPQQLLPLPAISAPPVPAPLPPPTSPGLAAAPPDGISPLLLQPGPIAAPPQSAPPAHPPPSQPAPIDQQKIASYRSWLLGQQRLLQRSGADDYLGREIQQQLLQLEQSDSTR
jgi:hypothetical protein